MIFLFIIGPILVNNSLTQPIMNASNFYAPIYIAMLILNSITNRPAVGLRLPKLPILFTAFQAIVSSRQFQTFIPAMSEERTIPM
jgi:hypothetical protein